jgi:hypothetical protein
MNANKLKYHKTHPLHQQLDLANTQQSVNPPVCKSPSVTGKNLQAAHFFEIDALTFPLNQSMCCIVLYNDLIGLIT